MLSTPSPALSPDTMERLTRMAARSRTRGVPEPTYRCPECLDTKWVEVAGPDDGLPPIAKPCRHCAPVAYHRWHEGHFAGRCRGCEECSGVRSGRVTVFDYAADGTFLG